VSPRTLRSCPKLQNLLDDGSIRRSSPCPLHRIRPRSQSQSTQRRRHFAFSFTWSPDGRHIAHVMDNSVCVTDLQTGVTTRLTARSSDGPRTPSAGLCVPPNGHEIAFLRPVLDGNSWFNQIFIVTRSAGDISCRIAEKADAHPSAQIPHQVSQPGWSSGEVTLAPDSTSDRRNRFPT
jgi:hypothetical protein